MKYPGISSGTLNFKKTCQMMKLLLVIAMIAPLSLLKDRIMIVARMMIKRKKR